MHGRKRKNIITGVSVFCLLIVFTFAMSDRKQKVIVEGQEQLSNKVVLSSVDLLAGANRTHKGADGTISSNGEGKDGADQGLIVPCVDDVRENGYPKNETGETYGPDVKEFDSGPDLVLVKYGDGYGYIRQSEMDNDGVKTPEDAVDQMRKEETRKINVYLQDGATCIGTFDLKGA